MEVNYLRGEWGLEGAKVTLGKAPYGVSILLDGGAGAGGEIRVEGGYAMRLESGEVLIDRGVETAEGSEVLRSSVSSDGSLSIGFSNGVTMTVQPSKDFEAWTFARQDRLLVICYPGGDVDCILPTASSEFAGGLRIRHERS